MALAVGAVLAGFFGVPARSAAATRSSTSSSRASRRRPRTQGRHGGCRLRQRLLQRHRRGSGRRHESGEAHASGGVEIGLMLFSVAIAGSGIWLALSRSTSASGDCRRPGAAVRRARTACCRTSTTSTSSTTRTVIAGTMASGRGLWAVDRRVVDGAVNGAGRLTRHQRLVLVADRPHGRRRRGQSGRLVSQEGSYWFRRVQTGLVQNYALLMLVGIVLFVGVYLVVR